MDSEEGGVNLDEEVSSREVIGAVVSNDRGWRVWSSVGGHGFSCVVEVRNCFSKGKEE
jgi:hypothetical protein